MSRIPSFIINHSSCRIEEDFFPWPVLRDKGTLFSPLSNRARFSDVLFLWFVLFVSCFFCCFVAVCVCLWCCFVVFVCAVLSLIGGGDTLPRKRKYRERRSR